jgi:hypothetical protein
MNTILFGAGASIPFFDTSLTSTYITEQILDIANWKKVLKKLTKANKYGYNLIDINEVKPVLCYLSNLNEIGCFNLNFEDIAEVLDKLSSYGFDALPQRNLLNTILSFFKPAITISAKWQHIPFLLREIIANTIIDMHKNHCISNYDKMISLQNDFIGHIQREDNCISLVSLNYDDIVPTSVDTLNYISCHFTDNTKRHKNTINIKDFFKSKTVAYFPHGNLRFVFTDELNVSYSKDIDQAEKERWDGLFNRGTTNVVNGSFSYDFNTFITTGKTKDNAFNNMPYSIYYQRLATDFLNSSKIFIIGYSFGDIHFNRLLRSFLYTNNENKVYVIDKYDSMVTMIDEYTDNSNIITKIHDTFQPDWYIIFNNKPSQKSPYNQLEVNKINQEGYGEIFDRIIFYKKGYDQFLNEFHKVLSEY